MITRTKLGFLILALLVATMATAAGILYAQLDRTNSVLRSTKSDLQTTALDLANTTEVLTYTQRHLRETGRALTDERLTRNRLQEDKSALTAHNMDLQVSLTMANDDNAALQSSLTTATTRNTTLQESLDAAAELETQLRTSLDRADERYANLNITKDRIDAENRELLRTVGTLEELQAQRDELQTEITILQEQRRPLILEPSDTRTTGFRCTGSMEPKITCLDTATWLSAFGPNDIVVGATISFQSTACELDGNRRMLAHRVIEVRTVDGRPEYLTKGDASRDPDCWLPHSAVDAYITALHKNTNPENEEPRNSVNSWRRAYDAAFRNLELASTTYETHLTAYETLRVRHGCPKAVNQPCSAYEPALTELVQAFTTARDGYRNFTTAHNAYSRARHYYGCWYKAAQNSQYPGHIPYICAPYVIAIDPPNISLPSR